jgi:hypothetical protein
MLAKVERVKLKIKAQAEIKIKDNLGRYFLKLTKRSDIYSNNSISTIRRK